MPVLFVYPGNEKLGDKLTHHLDCSIGTIQLRSFPDGESYVRIHTSVHDESVVLLCSLNKPDRKLLRLIYIAETVKEMGARSVMLVAPYLSYMRQDKRFHEGEVITSKHFASLISKYFDKLVTIDPHLHRYKSMDEIYSIKSHVVHVADKVAQWVATHVQNPLLIGPDEESEQWVSNIAQKSNAEHIVLRKIRHSDTEVEISLPNIAHKKNYTPVLIDDIISTGHTMAQTIKQLLALDFKQPICIGVHAIFSLDAYDALLKVGAAKIISCNTIEHSSNVIDISELLASGINSFTR